MDVEMNNPVRVCVFCTNMGIAGPHNHTIRDFSKKDAPVICPKLLSTKCTYCKRQGHTKKYCSLLQKKVVSNDASVNLCKRLHNSFGDNDVTPFKSQKIGTLVAAIAAMDMDMDMSMGMDATNS